MYAKAKSRNFYDESFKNKLAKLSRTWIDYIYRFSTMPLRVGESTAQHNFMYGDDHGWDETGYNGHPHLQTPVLDEMAAKGLRLDRFYSAHPSCSPTRGSIITGRYPNRYGIFTPNCSIRPEEVSIAQILSNAGYACGHFGKWHLGLVKDQSPINPGAMGFDE